MIPCQNSVWEVVPRPENKLAVGSRWIYKVKQVADGSIEKHKARFLAKGLSQAEGFDYEEKNFLVARYSSIRTILAFVVQMGWKIHQMDVKTTFLNGVIEEEVCIEQLEGFETFDLLPLKLAGDLKRIAKGKILDQGKQMET